MASCMDVTPATSEIGSSTSMGLFGSSTIGTTPIGFGCGFGSSPMSRGVQLSISSSTSAICGVLSCCDSGRQNFHTWCGR